MDSEPDDAGPRHSSYWDAQGGELALLHALRRCLRADEAMRRRLSESMGMGVRDLQALRLVIAGERAGEPVSPHALAEQLAVTTAATTKLLDRLAAAGHLERARHPRDRRSVVLHATDHAHQEVRARLAPVHERMRAVAAGVPEDSRAAVVDFLTAMARELEAGRPTE